MKKVIKYMTKHPWYNSTIHVIGGIGIGVLASRPYVQHPLRVGIVLLGIAVVGHLYPMFKSK